MQPRRFIPVASVIAMVLIAGSSLGVAKAAAVGSVVTNPGYSADSYAVSFPQGQEPLGVAVGADGALYVIGLSDTSEGFLYRFASSGAAGASTEVNTDPIPGRPHEIVFTPDGRLYLTRQTAGDVVELDPKTGLVLREVAAVSCATGLARDPLTGDLFVSRANCGTGIARVSNPAAASPAVTEYAASGNTDGLGFAPDGTLYAAVYGQSLIAVDGTDTPSPGTVHPVATIPAADGIAVQTSPSDPTHVVAVWVNRNDGIVTRVDPGTSPPAVQDVLNGGSRGDFAAMSSAGCLLATQSDSVLQLTNAGGSCPLGPPITRDFSRGDLAVAVGHGRTDWLDGGGALVAALSDNLSNGCGGGSGAGGSGPVVFGADGRLYALDTCTDNGPVIVIYGDYGQRVGTVSLRQPQGSTCAAVPRDIQADGQGHIDVLFGFDPSCDGIVQYDAGWNVVHSTSPVGDGVAFALTDPCHAVYSTATRPQVLQRYDFCNNQHLADLAVGLPTIALALRVVPDGKILAVTANNVTGSGVYLVGADGSIPSDPLVPASNLGDALALSTDGQSFYLGSTPVNGSVPVSHYDLNGQLLERFPAPSLLNPGPWGLAVQGEYSPAMSVDRVPPQVTVPSPITVEATSPAGATVTYTVTATDNADPNPRLTCTPPSGSVLPLGTTTVICSATDASGNTSSSSFTILVHDTTAPHLTLPSAITAEAASAGGATVTYTATAADAVDAHPVVSCTPASGTMFPPGTTTVTCTATDASGNTSSGSFRILVHDTTAPQLTIPAPITVNATGPSGAAVSYTATATDVVDPHPLVSCTPPSGATFPIGTTTVTCTATDASGNKSVPKSFTVTVKGAAQQITDLIDLVNSLNLGSTVTSSLDNKLTSAQTALNAGHVTSACSKLADFTSQVNDYVSANKLTASQAQPLLAAATRIRTVLAC